MTPPATAPATTTAAAPATGAAGEAWRVGVLFSRSGPTSVTETEHFLGTELAIAEINGAGGVLGRPIVPVVHDPGGDSGEYRALARRMLAEDDVSVIFGGSMSASRKAVLPIVERYNGLLFYPSMYEGFEYGENILYIGATLNQTIFPLADWLMARGARRVHLLGADYVFPRESNRVMRDLVESRGGEITGERHLPLLASPEAIAAEMEEVARLAPDVVFSTLVGRTAREFYRLYDAAGIDRHARPIASLTMAETEMREIGVAKCDGHVLAATYFSGLPGAENADFVRRFRDRFGPDATPTTWSEPAYLQVHLFARALAAAGSMDPRRLSDAALGLEMRAPGGPVRMDPETRHMWLTPRIGVARSDGGFDLAWTADRPVRPDPWLAVTRFEEAWTAAPV